MRPHTKQKPKREIKILHCNRCGYEWVQRYPDVTPGTCAGCNSRYWNKPRKNKVKGREA